jgi:ribose/xylose/arabinose/galactoside ABC-type transport system permease subunit
VILLGAIFPALTFVGINAYWEKAIQGAIIVAAIILYVSRVGNNVPERRQHASRLATSRA